MNELGLTQADVALACRITQPHLSKILSNNIKPGPKTEQALVEWLERTANSRDQKGGGRMAELIQRLGELAPRKKMQIMQLLEAVEAVVRK